MIETILGRLRALPGARAQGNSQFSSEMSAADLENYYLRIISESLSRMLVPPESVAVVVKRSSNGPGGPVFACYVRILRWDPVMTPVLLQNLPVIDGRIRKLVAASVLLRHTHFAGLWLQATSATRGAPRALVGMPSALVHQPGGAPP